MVGRRVGERGERFLSLLLLLLFFSLNSRRVL